MGKRAEGWAQRAEQQLLARRTESQQNRSRMAVTASLEAESRLAVTARRSSKAKDSSRRVSAGVIRPKGSGGKVNSQLSDADEVSARIRDARRRAAQRVAIHRLKLARASSFESEPDEVCTQEEPAPPLQQTL